VLVVVRALVPAPPVVADARIDEQGEKLTAFHQLGVAVLLVGLDVEQEPAATQNVAGIDDPDDSSSWVMNDGLLGRAESKKRGLCSATWTNSPVSIW